MKGTNISLSNAIKEIEKQTSFKFFYNSADLNLNKQISYNFKKINLDTVLEEVFAKHGIKFIIDGNQIILSPKKANGPISTENRISNFSGIVVDARKEPIIGANIMIKGGKGIGTISDIDGNFKLENIPIGTTILVSYIGFLPKEVLLDKLQSYTIVLNENTKQLEEVVVVGYGTMKKSDITGSVTSIKSSELLSAPKSSALDALQGRAAGVVIQNTSGDPSNMPSIRIRGSNSLTYGNSPLIIIDGIQDANLANLNPNQIESFQILKDAAALSIYGSRGANGVILVTTKTGGIGKPQINYNGFVSFDQIRRKLPTLDATEFAGLFEVAQKENNLPSIFSPDQIAKMGKGTNWQDAIFRDAFSHNHNLSINGSKGMTSYFIALTLLDKQGILRNSHFQEYSLRSNLKMDPLKWLNLQLTTFIAYNKSKNGSNDQAISSALQWTPTKPVYEPDGKYSQPGGGVGPNALYNPVGYTEEIISENMNVQANSALTAEVKFCDYLKFSTLIAFKVNSEIKGYFDNQVVQNGPSSDVYGHKTQGLYWSLQNTNILSFDKDFSGNHLQATLVYELLKDNYQSLWTGSYGIPVNMGYNGISYGTTLLQPWQTYTNTSMMSVMARLNYAYKNRYLFSGSARYDGASQLADGNKFNWFGAVSLGWNLMEEYFMEDYKRIIPEFKIRASYGSVGNAAVPAYSSHMKLSPGMDGNNNPTLTVTQLENKNLRWERTNEFNIGIDARFLNGRLSFSLEYYDKTTSDLLMWKKVPAVLGGGGSVLTNVGAVSNKGVDLSIGGAPITTKNFSWTINYTMNYNANKILALDGLSDILVYSSDADYPGLVGSFVQKVGEPMGTFLGFKYDGVWQLTEAYEASKYGLKPGDAKYVDQNNDNKIDDKDIVVIGNAQPKLTYGINNSFSYKGFDLNVFLQGVWGNQIYNQNRIRRESYAGTNSPTSPAALDHWTRENPSNTVPAFSGMERINSSRWVEDGSYLRVKNITLGYRFPEKWLSKIYMQSIRLYISANNLFTFTSYSGYDPEASIGLDAVAAGVDRGIYPSSKSVLIGLDITF